MRARFPGYYRPTDEQFAEFFDDGLICPDTSVLLSLYRVSEATREDVFSVFRAIGDRLWLPHQVALEFQRNRQEVIREQTEVYGELENELERFQGQLMSKVRRHHPRIDRDELGKVADAATAKIKDHLNALREAQPDPLSSSDVLGADVVRDTLDDIAGDRIGEAMDRVELEREGKSRYPRRIPPGYKDADKGDARQYGDLAVWLELLGEASNRSGPTVFITEDAKEDWWLIDEGKTIAPRPELVQEMHEKAESGFWMYRFEPFLSAAAAHFDIELGATVRAEVTDAQQAYLTEGPFENWNRYPFPSPAGPVAGFPMPASQGRFIFSPDNPHARPWSRYANQEILQWQNQLPSAAEIGESSVRISLFDAGAFGGSHLICSVSGPTGWVGNADVVPSGELASVVFPADFEGVDSAGAGHYHYTWSSRAVPETDFRVVIAQGNFSISQ
jgi:hypothetical protein